jgi:putative acetyltransferase
MKPRAVTSADAPAVVEHVRCVLAEFGIEFGVGADSDDELRDLPDSYASRGGAFWVLTDDAGVLLGTIGVMPLSERSFELRKMYLAPYARGQGLGAALFDAALVFVRDRGASELVLDTVDRMHDAIAFYERRGFVRDDRHITAPRCNRGYVLKLKEM